MSKITIIAAVADNYAIGKSNKLLWHLPADLKYFKELTTGHCIVMGKRTFESFPNGPLPNRKNIVLTSLISDGVTEGYFESNSIEDACHLSDNEDRIFIIGGATIYRQCINKADSMYITWVHAEFAADAYFPKFNLDEWEEISREDHKADEKNAYDYSFVYYERKKK